MTNVPSTTQGHLRTLVKTTKIDRKETLESKKVKIQRLKEPCKVLKRTVEKLSGTQSKKKKKKN